MEKRNIIIGLIIISILFFISGCGALSETGQAFKENIQKGPASDKSICEDGTHYGQCSETKPLYCYGGELVPRCKFCGCPDGESCEEGAVEDKDNKGQWGVCQSSTNPNVACYTDTGCGVSIPIGSPYCELGSSYQDYETPACINPGLETSFCEQHTEKKLVEDCGEAGCENGQCLSTPEPPADQTVISDNGDLALNGRTPSDGDSMGSYGWKISNGVAIYSSQKPHAGNLGFAVSSSSGTAILADSVTKVGPIGELSIWIYDALTGGNNDEASVSLLGGQNAIIVSLGIFSSKGYYSMILPISSSEYSTYSTGIPRTEGWHEFKINLNGNLYIDGQKASRTFAPSQVRKVQLQGKALDSPLIYMDDFSFTFS